MISEVLRAANFAARAHAGQTRNNAKKTPYINHLLEVAELTHEALRHNINILPSYQAKIIQAALLHDILEDTTILHDRLVAEFGEDVAALVSENTDDPTLSTKEAKEAQILKMPEKSFYAQIIKMADAVSNTRGFQFDTPIWPKTKMLWYLDTRKRLMEAASIDCSYLQNEFKKAYEESIKHVESIW